MRIYNKMMPKIEFVYSNVYDDRYRSSEIIQNILKEQNKKYPSKNKITRYISRVEKIWRKQEKKILIEIAKITNLKWKEDKIKCYVIGSGRSFSDPLTLKIFDNLNDFIDTLTHEMIHQIQSQNRDKYQKWHKYVDETYKKETELTKRHIFLHAVHKKLYLNLFDKKRLKRNIKRDYTKPDYKRSWEIVEKEEHDNIIKRFDKLIR